MTQYIPKHLIDNEHILYQTTYHWIIFTSIFAILTLFLSPIIQFNTAEFCINNQPIVVKLGWIRLKLMEMNFNNSAASDRDCFPFLISPARYHRATATKGENC